MNADVNFTVNVLDASPETIAARRERSAARFHNLEGPIAELEMLWALLEPYMEDTIGGATGPLNHIIEGGRPDLHVMAHEQAEALHYHLSAVGALIGQAVAIVREA